MIDLSTITPQKHPLPPRIILYGPLKIGKSTWASQAPGVIFQPVEQGIDNIEVSSLPVVKHYGDLLDGITALYEQKHDFKTYVLDTVDWLEPIIWAKVCDGKEEEEIEDFGYGKGYIYALTYWRQFLSGMDVLREQRGMTIVLLAHNQIQRYDNPETEPYDRHTIKLHKSANALMGEWSDAVLFANHKVFTTKTDVGFNKKVTRALETSNRVVYTTERPAFVAGNRYGLPEELPMKWSAFEQALNEEPIPF